MKTNPYDAPRERAARALSIRIADRCRALQRPVTVSDLDLVCDDSDSHRRDLMHVAEALGYITSFKFPAVTAWGPVGWTFGPERRGK